MDQFRSLLGDPVPTVPQHNRVTRPESLHWCIIDLHMQGIQSVDKRREYVWTLGCNLLHNVDQHQGGKPICIRSDPF